VKTGLPIRVRPTHRVTDTRTGDPDSARILDLGSSTAIVAHIHVESPSSRTHCGFAESTSSLTAVVETRSSSSDLISPCSVMSLPQSLHPVQRYARNKTTLRRMYFVASCFSEQVRVARAGARCCSAAAAATIAGLRRKALELMDLLGLRGRAANALVLENAFAARPL